MSQAIKLFEDSSNDIEEWLIAPSVPPLPLFRKRPRDKDVGGEDAQAADHRESREGIAASASQPMDSDSEQISRNDGSAKKRSKKRSTSKPPSSASGRQGNVSSWKKRFSELADYCKIYGHCNVPTDYSENLKLSKWVAKQRTRYRLHREGTKSSFKLSRIQELESMGFEWEVRVVPPLRLSRKRPRDKDDGSEDAQEADHREFHEGIAAAVSQPMNSDSEQISRNDGSAKKRSKKRSTSKPPSNTSGRQMKVTTWNDRLRELADYHEIYGHCNVPKSYSKNTKLANWVANQRTNYRLYQDGKSTRMTAYRIQELKRMGFEWRICPTVWEECLSELTEYRKVHGHSNVPKNCSENSKLARWVAIQRKNYGFVVKGKRTPMMTYRIRTLESLGFEWKVSDTTRENRLNELAEYRKTHGHCNVPRYYRQNSKLSKWVQKQRHDYKVHQEGKKSLVSSLWIQELESLGFEWDSRAAAWEDRFSELAEHHKIYGHCNVPRNCSKNTKLSMWIATQRKNYLWVAEGKSTPMTIARIQKMESLGFEWGVCLTAWEDRLSELADYRKIYGHCNVPQSYSGKSNLGTWVAEQRRCYRLHVEGKASPAMTPFRMQELENLGFEWKRRENRLNVTGWETRLSELADYRKTRGHCNVPTIYSENTKLGRWVDNQRYQYRLQLEGKKSHMTLPRIQALESLSFEWDCSSATWQDRLSELANYRKIHGHCENTQHTRLAHWVTTQRSQYRLQLEGKPSLMTLPRIQELESLGFEWKPSIGRKKGKRKKPSVEDNATCVRERVVRAPEHAQTTAQTREDFSTRELHSNQVEVAFESEESDWNGEVNLAYIAGRTAEI